MQIPEFQCLLYTIMLSLLRPQRHHLHFRKDLTCLRAELRVQDDISPVNSVRKTQRISQRSVTCFSVYLLFKELFTRVYK